jgi:hypothetical protein
MDAPIEGLITFGKPRGTRARTETAEDLATLQPAGCQFLDLRGFKFGFFAAFGANS